MGALMHGAAAGDLSLAEDAGLQSIGSKAGFHQMWEQQIEASKMMG